MSQADEFLEEKEGVALFGISMSPTILGAIIAVIGIAGAGWLGFKLVKPAIDARSLLVTDISAKEDQLSQQGDIQKRIETAQEERSAAQTVQREVLSMFASKDSLSTLLLDLNQQIEQRNTEQATPLADRLAARQCPDYVVNKFQEVKNKTNGFFAVAEMRGFDPVILNTNSANANAAAVSADGFELVQDGSLGSAANGQVKRQTYTVSFAGSFPQTQAIFRQLEQLQPLLTVKDVEMQVVERPILFGGAGALETCQPDLPLETTFTLQALLPLSAEELAQKADEAKAAEEAADGTAPEGAAPAE
jgi:type IV pilus assembly protein PilO